MIDDTSRLPLTVLGTQYLFHAVDFHNAALQLVPTHPLQWPKYFLLCHSIEVALKSYLIYHGATPESLKDRFGHRISDLLDEVIAKGLLMSNDDVKTLKLLHEAHTKFWARYPKEDWSTPVFVIDQFVTPTRALFEAISTGMTGGSILHALSHQTVS